MLMNEALPQLLSLLEICLSLGIVLLSKIDFSEGIYAAGQDEMVIGKLFVQHNGVG